MNNREKESINAKIANGIDKLISTKIDQALKKGTSTKEVTIKKIYNNDNYTTRRADVVFVDDYAQAITIKNVPVNIPQGIKIGDVATLFYLNNKPNNGWIGNLITYTSTGQTIAPPIDPVRVDTLEGKVATLEDNQIFHFTGLEANRQQSQEVWIDTDGAEVIDDGMSGMMMESFSSPSGTSSGDDVIIDLTK